MPPPPAPPSGSVNGASDALSSGSSPGSVPGIAPAGSKEIAGAGHRIGSFGAAGRRRLCCLAFLAACGAVYFDFSEPDHQHGNPGRRCSIRRWKIPGRGQERCRPAHALDPEHRDQYGHPDSGCIPQRLCRAQFLARRQLPLFRARHGREHSRTFSFPDADLWRDAAAAHPRYRQRSKPFAGWVSLCLPALDPGPK